MNVKRIKVAATVTANNFFQVEDSMKLVASLLIVTVFCSGCASMFHGTTETIYMRSEEADTVFYVGAREVGKGTSAVTTIPKKELKKAMLIAEKNGCNTKSAPIATSFDGVTLLGILLDWGVISILLVDWAGTGAVTQAAQKDYILTPECPKG